MIRSEEELLELFVKFANGAANLSVALNLAQAISERLSLALSPNFMEEFKSRYVLESARQVDDLFNFEVKLNSLPFPWGENPSALRINFVLAKTEIITNPHILAATLRLLSPENALTLVEKKPELFKTLLAQDPEGMKIVLAQAGVAAAVKIKELIKNSSHGPELFGRAQTHHASVISLPANNMARTTTVVTSSLDKKKTPVAKLPSLRPVLVAPGRQQADSEANINEKVIAQAIRVGGK